MKKFLFLLVAVLFVCGQHLSAQDHHWPLKADLNDAIGDLDGTNNGVSFENDATRGGVAYFNGEGYANLPSFINGNGDNLSVSCWWRMDEKQVWTRIYTFGTGDQSEPKDVMMVIPVSGAVEDGSDPAHNMYRFTLSDPGGWLDADFYKSEVDIAIDTWYFSAVVLTMDSVIVYHNDTRVLAESGLTTRSIGDMSDVENALGKSFWPDAMWKGALSELKVWNSKLSKEEVLAEYNAEITNISERAINVNTPKVYAYKEKIYVNLNRAYTDEVASVYSITGALVATKPVPEISNLKFDTGIYIVKIQGTNVNSAMKVFVE
jgi:hypothetical protein